MSEPSAKLGIPLPMGNEAFTRSAYRTVLGQIDAAAAAQSQVDRPFYLKSVTYDAGNNRLVLVVGPGRADFLTTLVDLGADTTYYINAPTTDTAYYLYLTSAGTFTHNTTGAVVAGAARLWWSQTGATLTTITSTDLRGEVPAAGARVVQDNLDTHAGSQQAHGAGAGEYLAKTSNPSQLPGWSEIQGKPSSFTPAAHKTTHAGGGSDVLTPGDIGAETPSGAQAKADAVQTNLNSHTGATAAGTHGSTSAATANTLMHRDASGRAKVAAPSAVDDIARKDTVDAVQTNLTNHQNASPAHAAAAISYAGGTGMSATDVEAAIDELALEKLNASEKGAASGVASLDASNKVNQDTKTLMGYAPGNASGNIPISNGTQNTNLNAQYHGGFSVGTAGGTEATRVAVTNASGRVGDSERLGGQTLAQVKAYAVAIAAALGG